MLRSFLAALRDGIAPREGKLIDAIVNQRKLYLARRIFWAAGGRGLRAARWQVRIMPAAGQSGASVENTGLRFR